MGRKRQTFSKDFKARVALEALREESTILELAVKYSVHPNQIMQWKKLIAENAASLFERPNKKSEDERKAEEEKDALMKVIGEQKVEVDFLKKNYRQYARLLQETIDEFGCPAIFNTDQGAQFTSEVFLKVLEENNIEISMDGRDRALDNIRIERLWRSLKYEDIYLKLSRNLC